MQAKEGGEVMTFESLTIALQDTLARAELAEARLAQAEKVIAAAREFTVEPYDEMRKYRDLETALAKYDRGTGWQYA
jgi:hypothetical protein